MGGANGQLFEDQRGGAKGITFMETLSGSPKKVLMHSAT
jgi:hypothetical protein